MLEILQEQLENGFYPPGKRLPSERKLAAQFQVPQSQIHRKLQQLVQDGFLDCFRGNGYFVRPGKPAGKKLHRIAFCRETPGKDMPDPDDFYAGLLLNLAPEYTQQITTFSIPMEESGQERLFRNLRNEGFEGIFCYPHFIRSLLPCFIEMKTQNFPLFFWDYSPFPGVFPSIGQDHFLSCLNAARILSRGKCPIVAVGFEDMEQNRLKRAGFHAGCQAFHVPVERELYLPYESLRQGVHLPDDLFQPGRVYFTMTRHLSGVFVGAMLDRGYLPGRDYFLLTIDRVRVMDGSSLQLDSIMRNQRRMVTRLLEEMQKALETGCVPCNDWRAPMEYHPGNSLPQSDPRS